MTKRKKLYLVDGTALAYRSHFAFIRNPLTDSSGRQTGAVFGFVQSLKRLIDVEKPDYLGMVFDAPGPTFRHEVYKEYKATRQKMEDGLVEQMPTIFDVVDAYRIPRIEIKGIEADDVIGTLALRAKDEGLDTVIVSGDKDFAQLVSKSIKLYVPGRSGGDSEIFNEKKVEEKFGVPPKRIIDLLALMGDSSDNVPGVPKVGPKTAAKLINEYGDLEAVLANAGGLKAKALRENLLNNVEQARLSLELVTLATDIELPYSVQDLGLNEPDRDSLNEIFTRLEFHSLVENIELRAETDEHSWTVIEDLTQLEDLLTRLREAGRFVMDLETTHLDPLRCELVGISFSLKPRQAYYVPLNKVESILAPGVANADRDEILARIKPLMEDRSLRKVGQNIKYDFLALTTEGIRARGADFDTMIASYLLEPGLRQHNLDVLSKRFLSYRPISTEEMIGKGKSQISMAEVPLEAMGDYACEDADLTARIEELFSKRLSELGLLPLFDEIEMPLVEVLTDMEVAGVTLDTGMLKGMSVSMGDKLAQIEHDVFKVCGMEFNLASPKQLGEVLFEKMEIQNEVSGRRKPKKTKTGYSTDSKTLERFAEHPAIQLVQEFRTISKLKSTYVDALPALVNPRTGRLHTSYNQAVAATGRLSSSDPNLQNIPIRTELGREIRKAFSASGPDRVLLSADYSQIELRIMAHISGDEALRNSFLLGEDVHRRTAATIFGVEPEDVDLGMRSRAKAVNFGIMYGMGPHRLASDTGITVPEAQSFIDAYFACYPKIKDYLDQSLELARETGVVRTLLGRLRPIPEIHSTDGRVRSNAENMAVNTPIQGSAADMIKKAMLTLHHRLGEEHPESWLILQVHDELVLDVPESELSAVTQTVKEEMEGAVKLEVPVVVEVASGKTWYEAHS